MGLSPRRLQRDTAGVSPIIGTVLVLAITVLGMASILYWGAPTIDRIQSRNAQTAVEGEFEGLRDASTELSVPDHSRFPTISVPGGSLAVQKGTRVMVTADMDPGATACDLHITDFVDSTGANVAKVTVGATGCKTPVNCAGTAIATQSCLEIYTVGGTTTVKQIIAVSSCTSTPTGTSGTVCTAPVVTGQDFSTGDWLFRLTDGTPTPTIYAQAWLHSNDQVSWKLASATGSWQEYLDAGAIFSNTGGTYFLEKEPAIGDTSFGPAYYGLWLRTFVATGYGAIDGAGSHQVFLSLLGNSLRVDAPQAYKLRFDFSGGLAQPWCNALLARNPHLTGALYVQDATSNCPTGNPATESKDLRSVTYSCTSNTVCPGTGNPFKFRFIHARIHVSLSI